MNIMNEILEKFKLMTRLLSIVIRIRIRMRLVAKVGLRDLLRAHFPQKAGLGNWL